MSKLITLIPTTTITASGTVTGAHFAKDSPQYLDKPLTDYRLGMFTLLISGKSFDASTTLDVYIQYSPDGGTTWDDLLHYTQITNAAVADGAYVAYINPQVGASAVDRVTTDASLAANNVRAIPWCDRIRCKYVGANISGTDTITIKVTAFLI